MPTIKDIREFLEMGWFPALVGVIAAFALLRAHDLDWEYVQSLPDWVFSAAAILLITCGSVVVANIFRLPIAAGKWAVRRMDRRALRRNRIRSLLELNDDEKMVICYFFTKNQRVFHVEI
ncbi:MAG: hypothetical protein ACU0CF_04755, partial [Sagittula sp.]|uniref:hypothetical protein n=1 Tax=Sagittula sp. TaxID=2038081 RepID=UPI00405974E2